MIQVQKFIANQLGENSYILFDETGECIFVDPGFYFDEEKEEIKDFISSSNLTPVKIVNTHCHFDHIMGVEFIRKEYGIPFHAREEEAFFVNSAVDQALRFGIEMGSVSAIDQFIEDETQVLFGNSRLNVIHVPGHSPGHIVLHAEEEGLIMAGDVLFYGSIGRTDLPGGSYEQLISNIKNKLFILPDDTKVYSGHGPETSIGTERESNPFLT